MSNNTSNISHITHDNPMRGYSINHSSFDNALNMDFEYGYLSLMTNFSTFVARTQDIYSNMEEGFSAIIEAQNERRIRSRNRSSRNINQVYITREASSVGGSSGDAVAGVGESENDVDRGMGESGESRESGEIGESRTLNNNNNNNINNHTNIAPNASATNNANTRTNARQHNNRDIFDIGSILYSVIPRTVLIDPNINTNGSVATARAGGLSIQQIEENTEIINYSSIPANEIINTECPITTDPFNSNSIVLRIKRCKHCFIPFRMMTWLETHSTCPMCRLPVINADTIPVSPGSNASDAGAAGGTENMTNLFNNIRENIMNISNNGGVGGSGGVGGGGGAASSNNATNMFNNLSNLYVDNVNDDSIEFSFDLPSQANTYESQLNYLYPQISRLFSSAATTMATAANTMATPTNTTATATNTTATADTNADDNMNLD